MDGHWHLLHTSVQSLPALYVKAHFSKNDYSIFVTDLISLWSEKLAQSEICHRAAVSQCSINPQDDLDQLAILLNKIEHALQGQIELADNTAASVETLLSLRLAAALPSPLPPLRWPLYLAKQDARAFAREVTCELLNAVHTRQSKAMRLEILLRDKDHVISRFLDRMESAGTDLTTVFPGTSGFKLSRTLSQRAQLERHVKGLSQYDPAAVRPMSADLAHAADVLTGLNVKPGVDESLMPGEWPETWESSHTVQKAPGDDSDEQTTDGEGHAAAATEQTPSPGAASSGRPRAMSSELEPQANTARSAPLAAIVAPGQPKSAKRLGRIGGPKATAASKPDPANAGPSDSATAQSAHSPSSECTVTPSPQKPHKTGSLGVINGKKGDSGSTAYIARSPPRPTLGSSRHEITGDPTTPPRKTPTSPHLTSVERANTRREELKHQLASQPVTTTRKRRKF